MEYETMSPNQGYAGIASVGYEGPADAVREDDTFTRKIMDRLKQITGTTHEARNDLGMLHDRQFGPAPQNASGGSGGGEKLSPSGRAGEVMAMLDHLQMVAAQVASQARALNVRV